MFKEEEKETSKILKKKRERVRIWEIILNNSVIYTKGTQREAEEVVYLKEPILMRPISLKEFMAVVAEKGVQVLL